MELDQYVKMKEVEKTHWWFCGRRKIVRDLILKYSYKSEKILEVGSGTGGNLQMLAKFGNVKSFEMNNKALELSKQNLNKKIIVKYGSCPDEIPYLNEKFDIICLLDVLEHIEDHKTTLNILKKMMSRDGIMILTVPAYKWLWSKHDELNHHFRRYTKKELNKLFDDKYLILKSSYFNFFLFPIALLSRLIDKIRKRSSQNFLNLPNLFINKILFKIFKYESKLLRIFNLPFGLSILIVVKNN